MVFNLWYRTYNENLATCYQQCLKQLTELYRTLLEYNNSAAERLRSSKEKHQQTDISHATFASIQSSIAKYKQTYHQRATDLGIRHFVFFKYRATYIFCSLERLRKAAPPVKQSELEKADAKCRKARDDYTLWVGKNEEARLKFVEKLTSSCDVFEASERSHLEKMKEYVEKYLEIQVPT